MRRTLDALVVGAGLMGRWHGYEIARIGSRVVGVVDPDLDAARRLARRWKAAAYPGLTPALARSDAAVVHLCTPTASHAALVAEALEARRHVLVEKPLTGDLPATRALVELAEREERLLCPVHQFPFQRGVARLRAEVRDGGLGPVRHLRFLACSAGAEGPTTPAPARVAVEILPHAFSLVHAFVPGGLGTVTWSARIPDDGEIRLAGVAGRRTAEVVVSMAARPPRTELDILGESGSGRADLFHGFATLDRGGTSRAWKVARPLLGGAATLARAGANLASRALRRQPAYPGLRELVQAFHEAVHAGAASPISPGEILAVAEAMEAVVRGSE